VTPVSKLAITISKMILSGKDSLPPLTTPDFRGRHNSDLDSAINRLNLSHTAKDLSTICIIPSTGLIPAKVVDRWMNIASQMNQKFLRIPTITNNKYQTYNANIEQILLTPKLNEFKYILTMEENYMPPFDGLAKLFENIDKYDAVSGLIYTKGEESKPMIYGHPMMLPSNYAPVGIMGEDIQLCLGLPTGFTLFKLDLFKDDRIPKPWFRTVGPFEVGKDNSVHDDQYFFENIHRLGYKVAVDTRVKVAHIETDSEVVW
jgi:hypothetical protein